MMLQRNGICRLLESKLRAEIGVARGPGIASLPPRPWPCRLPIGEDGLGSDSLELLTLAAAVNEMFHLHETGIEDALLARRTFGAWVDLIQQSWSTNAGRISFHTSGSTDAPKRCTHTMADLLAEADEHVARLRPVRILAAVPAHHIYGFIFSVLLPERAGCKVIDIRMTLPSSFQPGDVIVSFPDHWQYLARSLEHLPAVIGITSTAPMPAALAGKLRDRGLSRLIEVYGSSETAGVGWRVDPAAPFALLEAWTVREAPTGEGVLQLTGRSGRDAATPDFVSMVDARSFQLRRRVDGAVQVGGINVFPARVRETLERHPLVAHARVRPPAELGGRLKALVVAKDPGIDHDAFQQELESWISAQLQGPERPGSLTIAPGVPRNDLGKETHWAETP